MKITKKWLAEQSDLYLTELASLIIREKARREQISERQRTKLAVVHVG